MEINFHGLLFTVQEGKISLAQYNHFKNPRECGFVEIQVCGENKDTHMGIKMANSSEGRKLCYLSHTQTDTTLEIVEVFVIFFLLFFFEFF